MPIVSIIVPTFNRRAYLEKALVSIFAQTYEDFELIVVDDGSRDQTSAYLKEVDDPRLLTTVTHRVGAAQARNAGVQLAKGELIAFCDSDDIWMPDKLEKQLAFFDEKNPPVLVFSDSTIYNRESVTDETVFTNQQPHRGHVFKKLLLDNFIPTSSVILKKDVLDQAPGFETAFCPAEDYRLWLRLALLGRFDYLHEPLTGYRKHGNQTGADLGVMFPACADVITNALMQGKMKVEDVPSLGKRLWQLHFVAGRALMDRRKPHRARRQYDLACQYRKYSKAQLFKLFSYIGG